MIRYIKNRLDVFKRYRPLLMHLVTRDIKVKYRRSVLGVLWSVLNPLLMMLVQATVFSIILDLDGFPFDFPVYLLTGQMMFNFFSESTNLAMESVLSSSGLIKKVYIPKYLFPLEKVMFSFVNTLFTIAALLVVAAFRVGLSWYILLLPVPLLILFVFNFGLGLILAGATVFFRDIKHFYGVFVMMLNYLTPIFYPITNIKNERFLQFIYLNPLTYFVGMVRNIVLEKVPLTLLQIGITSVWSLGLLVVGMLVFRKIQDRFILHI